MPKKNPIVSVKPGYQYELDSQIINGSKNEQYYIDGRSTCYKKKYNVVAIERILQKRLKVLAKNENISPEEILQCEAAWRASVHDQMTANKVEGYEAIHTSFHFKNLEIDAAKTLCSLSSSFPEKFSFCLSNKSLFFNSNKEINTYTELEHINYKPY